MSHGKKLLLILILAPAAVYLGLKGYIHHNVKAALEQLTTAAGPFVSIRYGGIRSSLDGSITVENVKLQPTGMTDVIPIRELTIETPGLGFLLSAKSRLANGDVPDRLRVALTGLNLDLSSSMMSSLDSLRSAVAATRPASGRAHCGGVRTFGPSEYRKLGYETLDMDIATGYQLDKNLGRIVVTIDWRTRDMARLESTLTFSGREAMFRPGATERPQLTAVQATYTDLSYLDRVKRYCAEADGVSVDDYVRAVISDDSEFIAVWGFAPGPGLREAHRQFVQKPGEFRIEAHPGDGFDPRSLALYKPQDIPAMLNLTLQVNGTPVTDLSLTEAPPAPATAPGDHQPASATPSRTVAAPPAPEPPGYRRVKPETLAQYIGRAVRVRAGGQQRQGVLAEVAANVITIERRYGAGNMAFKVPIKQISLVEVLFE